MSQIPGDDNSTTLSDDHEQSVQSFCIPRHSAQCQKLTSERETDLCIRARRPAIYLNDTRRNAKTVKYPSEEEAEAAEEEAEEEDGHPSLFKLEVKELEFLCYRDARQSTLDSKHTASAIQRQRVCNP